ncbi:MAG: aminoacetone oxidase family FAD-binding enzyme [Lentisphaeria bacterium]|nr:aminoacetone oxidase family FAD-binding enzyme [Lentisphaeria bacterium]
MTTTAEVIIIGAGAAGLMAGVAAGEAGLACLVLERRHRPGLKLLLCGNNRCNISHAGEARDLVAAYGEPVGAFLQPALAAFPPSRLRRWFEASGLPTCLHRDRIYPTSEKADDVLHCFTDRLRDLSVPLVLNCPVSALSRQPDGTYQVHCGAVQFSARQVLLATGGVSYPKTGSVGDGQRFAGELGHAVLPLRPGLAGMESTAGWLPRQAGSVSLAMTRLTIWQGGRVLAVTEGNVLVEGNVLRGTAVFDASRLIARNGWTEFELTLDVLPGLPPTALAVAAEPGAGRDRGLSRFLAAKGLEPAFAGSIALWLEKRQERRDWGRLLQALPLAVTAIRPVKEAIATVGGVDLSEINPETMESRLCPGLYFAGEVMDVDGPTGGYNLHAAFATARLAIQAMAGTAARVGQPAGAMAATGSVRAGEPSRRGGAEARGAAAAAAGGRRAAGFSGPDGRPSAGGRARPAGEGGSRRRPPARWETPPPAGDNEAWRQRKRGSK